MKIAVLGANPTGLSIAVALAQFHRVRLYDSDRSRVDGLNAGQPVTTDQAILQHVQQLRLALDASTQLYDTVTGAEFVIIAMPTRYEKDSKKVVLHDLDRLIEHCQRLNPKAPKILETTTPVGYTKSRQAHPGNGNLITAPALLRPEQALHDRLYPNRFIVGEQSDRARAYTHLMQECARLPQVPCLYTGSSEAEAIQLLCLQRLLGKPPVPHHQLSRFARQHELNIDHLLQGLDAQLTWQIEHQ